MVNERGNGNVFSFHSVENRRIYLFEEKDGFKDGLIDKKEEKKKKRRKQAPFIFRFVPATNLMICVRFSKSCSMLMRQLRNISINETRATL